MPPQNICITARGLESRSLDCVRSLPCKVLDSRVCLRELVLLGESTDFGINNAYKLTMAYENTANTGKELVHAPFDSAPILDMLAETLG